MNLSAIFSKTGKGVQEASGKTSHLSRGDRNVLKEIDGKTSLGQVAKKFEKITEDKFDQLIQQLDKDGFIREVSSGASQPAAPTARPAAPPPRAAPPPPSGGGDDMDFTAMPAPKAPPAPPKAPAIDLAAAARADAERKAKEQQAFDFKGRQEAEAKAKAEAEAKTRAAAEAKAAAAAKAAAEAKARAEAEAKARAETAVKAQSEAAAKVQAEADAKVKAAREAAVRMATEAKAKAEADAKVKTEAAEERARKESEDKARLEAELKGKLEEERKAREDAERRAREAGEQARREAEEKAKREAEELRLRLEAEMRTKLEEERRAREEEDRKRREEEERRRKEEDERRAKEESERRAKEAAERRAREEEDRKRREEEDGKRREEDERRRKEDEEQRAKEAAERRAREEEDRKRRKEDEERRAKEEAERRAREEEDRKRRDEEDRRRREEAERREKEEAQAKARASQAATPLPAAPAPPPAVPPTPPAAPAPAAQPAAAADGSFGDSLLADLDSFTQRDEDERKAKEEAERKAKEEAERKAKEEADRRAREEAEKKKREEEERRRKEEEERRAQEEAEQRAREEEERRKHEEAERKRKAKEALAAKEAEQRAAEPAGERPVAKASPKAAPVGDDIGVTEDDLDMEDVKRDEKKLGAEARKAARERERAESRRGKDEPAAAIAAVPRKPVKWGKRAATFLFVVLIVGVGLLHVMPVSTADYEKAASEAFGAPVKIGSARLSVITGVEIRFEGVSVGDSVKIRQVRGLPEIGSLFGARKAFSRVELEGLALSQEQLGDALLGKASGENFRIGRIEMKQAKLDGPLALPPLDVIAVVSGDGSLQSISLHGGDKLSAQLSPKGSEIGFEISAGSLALPFVPALTLSDFGMKGTATRQGVTSAEFDGRAFDGLIAGTARIRWGANWSVEGEVRVRGMKVAVFAPALVSEGKIEGRGVYGMSGPAPARLFESTRLEGNFKIENGVLGSFDLTRALQTGGAQSGGRTMFTELTGQGLYDKGAIQFRNIAVVSGAAMNAGASLDIDAGGALSGRIAADVKTPNQTLRAMLNISGKIQDPVIRK